MTRIPIVRPDNIADDHWPNAADTGAVQLPQRAGFNQLACAGRSDRVSAWVSYPSCRGGGDNYGVWVTVRVRDAGAGGECLGG